MRYTDIVDNIMNLNQSSIARTFIDNHIVRQGTNTDSLQTTTKRLGKMPPRVTTGGVEQDRKKKVGNFVLDQLENTVGNLMKNVRVVLNLVEVLDRHAAGRDHTKASVRFRDTLG
jgi:hypothetical protein